jgi:hypothetical protein
MSVLTRLAVPVLAGAALAACAQPASPGTFPNPPSPRPSASPSDGAGCPEPGVRIVADRGDAAAGYREMALRMTNCGDRPYTVTGRPGIAVLGKDRESLEVDVVPSVHHTQSPHAVTLAPGQSTTAIMSWRNLVTDPTVVATSGVYLLVAPAAGEPRQLVKPPLPLDLGNTGRLEVSVWL